jgi:hypothetical protein
MSALALAKRAGFKSIAGDVWFGLYDPEARSITLSFSPKIEDGTVQAYELRLVADPATGAAWVTLDGVHHTIESLGAVGRFAIPLSDYLVRSADGGQFWFYSRSNIEPLATWLEARGDDTSAQRVRDTFPKLFMPPAEPEPQPQSAPARKRGLFRRR